MPMPTSPKKEVVAARENDRRQRRRWSAEEKKRILREAEKCTKRGELAALLRREGIYSSLLGKWRQQAKAHGEEGLVPKKAGRKPVKDEKDRRIEKLERRNARLEKNMSIARKVIELQKKAHEILGIALPGVENDER
jgi:transposase-like protein